ncbi:phosphodiesterase [bacterium]|nr:phosphodiesterase [bacterium]
MILVQISDTHLGFPGAVDPERALERAVRQILAIEPSPAAVLVSGDLTHNGSPEEYQRLRQLLSPLTMPVHPLMGNHDKRQALREAFADHAPLHNGRETVDYSVDCAGLRLICLDSCKPDSDAGQLLPEQLTWLRAQLEAGAGAATMVALHHPPFPCGMDQFDLICLPPADRQAFAQTLEGVRGLEGVMCGHIHRPIVGRVGTVPAMVCPSVFLQSQLNLKPQGALRLIPGGVGLAVHIYTPGQPLLTHIQALDGD